MPQPASPGPYDATGSAPRSPVTRSRAVEGGQRGVLVAIRSAVALHRLLDVLPVFDGDDRVRIRFTLVPGSRLLAETPHLAAARDLPTALAAVRATDPRGPAAHAFAHQGEALTLLRGHLYRLLGLRPPATSVVDAPAFPAPTTAPRQPDVFAVRAEVSGDRVTVHRFPPDTPERVHHLAAEHPTAGPGPLQSAAVLWHHARTRPLTAHHAAWTASGWTASALDEMPGCRTAAAILTRMRLLLHPRGRAPLTVTTEPHRE